MRRDSFVGSTSRVAPSQRDSLAARQLSGEEKSGHPCCIHTPSGVSTSSERSLVQQRGVIMNPKYPHKIASLNSGSGFNLPGDALGHLGS